MTVIFRLCKLSPVERAFPIAVVEPPTIELLPDESGAVDRESPDELDVTAVESYPGGHFDNSFLVELSLASSC